MKNVMVLDGDLDLIASRNKLNAAIINIFIYIIYIIYMYNIDIYIIYNII